MDLGHTVEEHRQRDASLEPSETRTRAHVRATAERDVTTRIGTIDAERVRVVEDLLVAVGRQDPERHLVARLEVLAVQVVVLHAVAQQEPDRRIVAQ